MQELHEDVGGRNSSIVNIEEPVGEDVLKSGQELSEAVLRRPHQRVQQDFQSSFGEPTYSEIPGVYSFEELEALSIEKAPPAVEGLIYERQNVLLVGTCGVGKTMLMLQMSMHLAAGRNFLGRKVQRPYKVLFVDCENDVGDMKEREIQQRKTLALTEEQRGLLRQNWRIVNTNDPEHPLYGIALDKESKERPTKEMTAFHQLLSQTCPEILIIDNLGLVTETGDLDKPESVKAFYAILKHIRAKHPYLATIIILHHLTKIEKDMPSLYWEPQEYLARARGSGRLLDYAQCRLALAEEPIKDEAVYVVNGFSRGPKPMPLLLQLNSDTLSFEWLENRSLLKEQLLGNSPRQAEMWNLLPGDEPFTWGEALNIVNHEAPRPSNGKTLATLLTKMCQYGFLKHNGKQYQKSPD